MSLSFNVDYSLPFGDGDHVIVLRFLAALGMLIGGSALLCLLCKICESRSCPSQGKTIPQNRPAQTTYTVSFPEFQPETEREDGHIGTPSKEKQYQSRDFTDNARLPLLLSDSLQMWPAARTSDVFGRHEVVQGKQHKDVPFVHIHRNVNMFTYVSVPCSRAQI